MIIRTSDRPENIVATFKITRPHLAWTLRPVHDESDNYIHLQHAVFVKIDIGNYAVMVIIVQIVGS